VKSTATSCDQQVTLLERVGARPQLQSHKWPALVWNSITNPLVPVKVGR
jgi:hypothetical protein